MRTFKVRSKYMVVQVAGETTYQVVEATIEDMHREGFDPRVVAKGFPTPEMAMTWINAIDGARAQEEADKIAKKL